MNHRPSRRGYHSSLRRSAPCLALLAAGCALLPAPREPLPAATGPPVAVPAEPWRDAKAATLAGINAARASAGLPPLAWDGTLERVGEAFCATLVDERGVGHVASDGVPPYLRALLAGAEGFHRENVGSYDSSATVSADEVRGIALLLLEAMLAETPPDDGHRRTLLEPSATHVGVGVWVRGGSVRITHEVASRGAVAWTPPPLVVRPLAAARLAGRLARQWRPAGVEVLWQALPAPRRPDDAPVRSYTYAPARSMTLDRVAGVPLLTPARREEPTVLDVEGDAFAFAWKAGPGPGVETTVVWAARAASVRTLTAVAAGATVVTPDGVLPPSLQRWAALRGASSPR